MAVPFIAAKAIPEKAWPWLAVGAVALGAIIVWRISKGFSAIGKGFGEFTDAATNTIEEKTTSVPYTPASELDSLAGKFLDPADGQAVNESWLSTTFPVRLQIGAKLAAPVAGVLTIRATEIDDLGNEGTSTLTMPSFTIPADGKLVVFETNMPFASGAFSAFSHRTGHLTASFSGVPFGSRIYKVT